MVVLIKDMEMPKNCLACKLRGDGSDSRYIWDCPFTGFEYTSEEGETGRLDDCPLVEVPAAQSEIVRCKDCKHYHTDVWGQELGIEGLYGHIIVAHNACDRWSEHMNSVDPDGFCFLAERRTDE